MEDEEILFFGVVHSNAALDDGQHVFPKCFAGHRRRVLEFDEEFRISSEEFSQIVGSAGLGEDFLYARVKDWHGSARRGYGCGLIDSD